MSGILEAKVNNTELVEEEYITSEIISFSFIAEYHAKNIVLYKLNIHY